MTERTPEQQAEDKLWTDMLGAEPKRDFVLRTFNSSPAMVKKEPVNGHRMWTQFDPERYTKEEWDIVEGMWNHEECSICLIHIDEADPYWVSSENHILCPGCYEKFQKRS